jgi:hypothetical protein
VCHFGHEGHLPLEPLQPLGNHDTDFREPLRNVGDTESLPVVGSLVMAILEQFLLRLSFGLSFAMALTSPRLVPSGFYRVHLHVVFGLCTLASLAAHATGHQAIWPPLVAAALSYLGSILWLTERERTGMAVLVLISAVTLWGSWQAAPLASGLERFPAIIHWLTPPTAGLVLGAALAAMLLGHWYLNTPSMRLEPLERLVTLLVAATLLRIMVCGAALTFEIAWGQPLDRYRIMLLVLRWLAGLLGVLALACMTWKTLRIPNTQSATGILYVAVVGAITGELAAQLLSAVSTYPL